MSDTLILNQLRDDEVKFDQIARWNPDSGEPVPDEFTSIYPEDVWYEHDAEWFLARIDGPEVVLTTLDDDRIESADPSDNQLFDQSILKQLEKVWIPYEGPQGGEGWIDTESREVVYDDEPPGETGVLDAVQQTIPGSDVFPEVEIAEPEWVESYSDFRPVLIDTLSEDFADEVDRRMDDGDYPNDMSGYVEAISETVMRSDEYSGEDLAAVSNAFSSYRNSPWDESVSESLPEEYDPNNMEELEYLWETDNDEGVNADSMMVGRNESGERVFFTNINANLPGIGSSGPGTKFAYETSKFIEEMRGAEVPNHEFVEGELLAVEEASGEPVSGIMGGRVPKNELAEFTAVNILAGNWDLHSGNFADGWNGLEVFDLDHAGFDMDGGDVDQALGNAYMAGANLGATMPYDEEEEEEFVRMVEQKLNQYTDSAREALEAVDDEEVRSNIESNIEKAESGELITDETEVWY